MTDENRELALAYDFVAHTGRHVFLTGKAGTGKTTFLHTLKQRTPKRMIVVAPTGVAAVNAGGVTIHSFFQLPFGPLAPGSEAANRLEPVRPPGRQFRFSRQKIDIIRSLDLLVIDEISMVRADLLDGVDAVLRRFRPGDSPFGGVQLLMIGDLHQLAPVAKEDEWKLLRNHYETVFFFGSRALARSGMVSIELQHIYRQSDKDFIDLLASVRENRIDGPTLEALNQRWDPAFAKQGQPGYITLTTHNQRAEKINASRLKALPGGEKRFQAAVQGEFPAHAFPTVDELVLKPGAQVMFVRNDPSPEKRYFNGKIGRLVRIGRDKLIVECPEDSAPIEVETAEWQNIQYTLDSETREIRETVTGTFTQYPLKLAWAITIHKSQGLTFERAIIDAAQAFADGQVYVALSRCTTLEGLVLSTPLERRCIKSNTEVAAFNRMMARDAPDEERLRRARRDYQLSLLDELFDFSALRRALKTCLKIAGAHRSILVGVEADVFQRILDAVDLHVALVAEKFGFQRHAIARTAEIPQDCAYLQERVGKAAVYFAGQIELLVLGPMNGVTFETDNREVAKALEAAITAACKEAQTKRFCLESCREGIVFGDYLKARSRALLQETAPESQPAAKTLEKTAEIENSELYRRLKDWRNAKAREEDLPAFMILPNKVLAAVAAQLPATSEELRTIKGLGGKKGKRYATELLEMVAAHRSLAGSASSLPQKEE